MTWIIQVRLLLFKDFAHVLNSEFAGVPNTQLIKEGNGHGKSVAEVHSLNMAWELLMQDKYKDLRAMIYTTQEEYNRFRSVFISVVLSTDIMDKDCAAARRKRWESAFSEGFFVSVDDKRHSRATIIIEHLMQASDVAHTVSAVQVIIHNNTIQLTNSTLMVDATLAFVSQME